MFNIGLGKIRKKKLILTTNNNFNIKIQNKYKLKQLIILKKYQNLFTKQCANSVGPNIKFNFSYEAKY